jgi:hypothetical protein
MRRVLFLLSCCLAAGVVSAAPPVGLRILQHEVMKMVGPQGGDRAGEPAFDRAGHRVMSFEAYGRRFDLRLERNERLRFLDPARTPGVEALRGTVAGAPGSWVRLTRTPAGLFGLLSDGRDLYAIEPAAAAAQHAVGPVAARGTAPVVYRLADTLMPPGEASCGVVSLDALPALRARTAEQSFEQVGAQLQALAATLPTRQIEVAVVGDFEFSTLAFAGGLMPEAAIAARMNVVDGIYSSQVGVRVVVTDVTVFRGEADPFTSTTVASTLLNELGTWRRATPSQAARGLTHLLTGRDLDGSTVGIAFLGAPCSPRGGAGLTQGTLSQTNSALVIAHEIGHNFGAPHDAEAGSACEAAPATFLMAPRLNGSDRFSQCSLERIAPVVAAASCVTALSVPDAGLDLPPAPRRLRGAAFDYGFEVRSLGAASVEGLVATVTLPAGVVANGSSIAGGGSCASGANGTLTCTLGSLAPQATRSVTLNLTGQQAGAPTLRVALTAANDGVAGNDASQVVLTIDPSADLATTLALAPASIVAGGSAQLTATLQHLAGDPVGDARLAFDLPAEVSVTAVAANGLGCALQGGAVNCPPAALASGASQAVTLTIGSAGAGNRTLRASVSASVGDPAPGNNAAQAVLAATTPVVSGSMSTSAPTGGAAVGDGAAAGGGGGGGGSLDRLLLLVLASWWLGASGSRAPLRRAGVRTLGRARRRPQAASNTR